MRDEGQFHETHQRHVERSPFHVLVQNLIMLPLFLVCVVSSIEEKSLVWPLVKNCRPSSHPSSIVLHWEIKDSPGHKRPSKCHSCTPRQGNEKYWPLIDVFHVLHPLEGWCNTRLDTMSRSCRLEMIRCNLISHDHSDRQMRWRLKGIPFNR